MNSLARHLQLIKYNYLFTEQTISPTFFYHVAAALLGQGLLITEASRYTQTHHSW